jgi:membrane-bound metal-dependent hydrolase YbcI (DUF457 family)
VQGENHAVFGAILGLSVAHAAGPFIGTAKPELKLLAAAVAAGASLLADLDAPKSKASRFLAPLTVILSWLVVTISKAFVAITRTDMDVAAKAHRTLTHTLLGMCLVAASWGLIDDNTYAAIGAIGFLACLGGSWIGAIVALGAIAVNQPLEHLLATSAAAWPLAILVGYLSHLIGDSLTPGGTPLFAPFKIAGQRWAYLHSLPKRFRFLTGGPFERLIFRPFLLWVLAAMVWFLVIQPARG